ncbi:DUF6328 family protein [Oerskovia rustica]|uniref:DUF6328 family protein n=1 Tax=Oerskovia rustica TaxID=2762237 RepID=UPI001CD8F14A|nr:DUF6328 family protein [Oerskovia rustica]
MNKGADAGGPAGSSSSGDGAGNRQPDGAQDGPIDDSRDESADERADRNWAELLQELRVTQMGVQILTGFLLTLPFQQRFGELDTAQRNVYLCLVVLSVIATGLLVAPVSLHRMLFRKHLKARLVTSADRLARVGLVVLALVVTGTVLLIFDVVVGWTAAVIAAVSALVLFALLWVALPLGLMRRAQAGGE